jgi:AICAR transformylase/IMP cyclohydrolase PurH
MFYIKKCFKCQFAEPIVVLLLFQVIGIGAGQQSRIHCTRLAGDKANNWYVIESRITIIKFLVISVFN